VPVRVDPHSLATMGPTDFSSGEVQRISAHAKVDHQTGEMMFFDYGLRPPFLSYGVVGADGVLRSRIPIEVAGPRLPHDMAITENHSIVMDLPVHFRPEALKLSRWLVEFNRDMPARFAILPRHGDTTSIRWFEAEPCYIYHTVNAWEEGDEIVMVGCRCDDPTPAPDPRDGELAHAMANLRLSATLHEWRFNLATGQTRERRLDDRNTEFPAMDTQRTGRKSRYSYHATIPGHRTLAFDGIARYDIESGACTVHPLGEGRFGSECTFAPGPGQNRDEDDGYVVSFVYDAREDRSEVIILDASRIDAEPLARVRLPQRVPLGFHACWIDDTNAETETS
jgi:carotenoid cleavage dioxygenase